MLFSFTLQTQREQMINITDSVKKAVSNSKRESGLCVVFCPHTTAGITINENADPDVVRDMLLGLAAAYPERPEFRHAEGNSAAHLKASSVGSSVTVIIEQGRLLLGTWQGIYFCEFDGPRRRQYYIHILSTDEVARQVDQKVLDIGND